jgi:hypothetical protein
MRQQWLLFPIVFMTWLGFSTAVATVAVGADLTTPEGAVAAYIDGVANQDLSAIIAATAVDNMSKKSDFVNNVDRIRSLTPYTPAPTTSPFFKDINKSAFTAQITRQVQFLVYGLMTTNEVLEGKVVTMDQAGATDFANVVRADRLTTLKLVKVSIPSPKYFNSERTQKIWARMAQPYGADALTERIALVSFDGLQFAIGFSLLRYGDDWAVSWQSSTLANLNGMGVPKRVTTDEFEAMIQ